MAETSLDYWLEEMEKQQVHPVWALLANDWEDANYHSAWDSLEKDPAEEMIGYDPDGYPDFRRLKEPWIVYIENKIREDERQRVIGQLHGEPT